MQAVAQTSSYFQSAVSRISNPPALGSSQTCRLAAVAPKRRSGAPRRRKVGDTAGWKRLETCATSALRKVCKVQGSHRAPFGGPLRHFLSGPLGALSTAPEYTAQTLRHDTPESSDFHQGNCRQRRRTSYSPNALSAQDDLEPIRAEIKNGTTSCAPTSAMDPPTLDRRGKSGRI